VPAVSFGRLLREHGVPHYLQESTSRARTCSACKAWPPAALKPAFVSIESNKTSWKNLVAEFDELRKLGYTPASTGRQPGSVSPEQKEPQPAREGLYAGHQFPEGSTGLFGDDLPGKWVSRQRAAADLRLSSSCTTRCWATTRSGSGSRAGLPLKVFLKVIPGWYEHDARRRGG